MQKLVLIDGNSLINRAFYATPAFTTKDGTPTNGVFGFIKLLLKIVAEKKPDYFAVAFDLHAPTFRHKMYDAYKAGRKPMPEELAVQMPILKELLTLMHIRVVEFAGYEADDVLGTLSRRFDVTSYIYTGDRDAYQLVNERTHVCYTRKGVSDILELTSDNFKDETGLTPSQIIDLKSLMGDKSDNIPGVAGVGEKSALTLLEQFNNLEGVYAHIDEISGALYTKLVKGKEDAFFSKKLATIDTDVPLDVSLSECVLKIPFGVEVKERFAQLEFKSLLALDIFEQELEQSSTKNACAMRKCNRVEPASIEEVLLELKDKTYRYVAVDWTDKEFCFTVCNHEDCDVNEYVMPIKESLLDTGFFESELYPILDILTSSGATFIAYNVKEWLHRLDEANLLFPKTYEDVSILKYIRDGLANTSDLTYCLNQNALPENNRAYGLYVLFQTYSNELTETERKLYNETELPLVEVLFDMEKTGVCVDFETMSELSARYSDELSALKTQIWMLAGEEFNVNSTQQLGKVLFEKLKIGGDIKKKNGKNYKTTAEELEKYADSHEIVRVVLRYRKIQKLYSTYVEGFKPLIAQGKVHTTYTQCATETGRLSSIKPNVQNIPVRTEEGRELRKLFKASENNVFIDADYSQIELRLLAHFSACPALIQAYCENQDIHASTASQVFNVPLEYVTPELRREAKAVNFGIIYGISAFGLANDLNISTKQAKAYIDKYFETYPEVKTYMSGNVEKAKNDGYVTTLLGRRRVINEIRSSNFAVRSFGERASMNMPLQGSSADIIKRAMINVYHKLKQGGYKAKLVLQVHDELIIDCPTSEKEAVSKLLKDEMENAVTLSVPLTVDVGIGVSWYETK